MITVRNEEDGTVCGIDEFVMNWVDQINHLCYDQDMDTEMVMVAVRLLDSINNSTGSHWGIEHVDW